jgi:hypothetical protein
MTDSQFRPADDARPAASESEAELSRRVFHQLSLAALSGLMAGSLVGCSGEDEGGGAAGTHSATDSGTTSGGAAGGGSELATTAGDVEPFDWTTAEKHVCRGLNTCMNKGASGENACAGQGTCASPEAHHACGSMNECKGLGGCGEHPGENDCKGKGGCHVPLHEGPMWDAARERFEEAMTAKGLEFGDAPPAM